VGCGSYGLAGVRDRAQERRVYRHRDTEGQFPKRVRLLPTTRVGWLRRQVAAYLRRLAKSATQETDVEAVNENFVARSKRSGPTPEESAR